MQDAIDQKKFDAIVSSMRASATAMKESGDPALQIQGRAAEIQIAIQCFVVSEVAIGTSMPDIMRAVAAACSAGIFMACGRCQDQAQASFVTIDMMASDLQHMANGDYDLRSEAHLRVKTSRSD